MSKIGSGRARRTAAQWEALLAEQSRSGLTQDAFCRLHGLGYSTFGLWRARLRRNADARSGYCVWSKRLERGRFAQRNVALKQPLSVTQLKLLLEGIELQNIRQTKRFSWKKGARELHFCA